MKWIHAFANRKPDKTRQKPADQTDLVPACLVSGISKATGKPLRFIYTGNHFLTRTLWTEMMMESVRLTELGAIDTKELLSSGPGFNHDVSMVLAEEAIVSQTLLHCCPSLLFPNFVQMYIDTSRPVDELEKVSRAGFANAHRLIDKHKLSICQAKGEDAQMEFYQNMYLPYLISRAGESIEKVAFNGIFTDHFPVSLYFIQMNEEIVGGAVVHHRKERHSFGFLGIKDGAFDCVRKGALTAAYYFLSEQFFKDGINRLYLGGSPPFLNHPLTRHKIRMTARLDKEYNYQPGGCTRCFLSDDIPGSDALFAFSPFVFLNVKKNPSGMMFLGGESSSNPKIFIKTAGLMDRIGLDNRYFVHPDETVARKSWLMPSLFTGNQSSQRDFLEYLKNESFIY